MLTDKLPKDPHLPQLETMWNADLMADVFRKHLRPLGKETFHIETCQILRFRYRSATRSIVLYELHLIETSTGKNQTIWITGTTYPENRAKKKHDKLLETLIQRTIPTECFPFEPVSFFPHLKMIAQIFPFDRCLPTLPALIKDRPPILETLFLDQFGEGHWRTEKWRVEPVRYRAFLCATLRYTLDAREVKSNRLGSKNFYVKVLRSDGKKTHDLLQTLRQRFFEGKEGFTTVKPLAYLENLNCLILETAPGKPLEQLILEGKELDGAVLKSAAALANFHQSHETALESHSKKGTLSGARKAADFIGWACPDLSERVESIMQQLEYRSESRMEEVPLCPTHLDIKVDHLFIDGDQVVFIDLDSFALSDPVFDPASFLAQIELLPTLSTVPRARLRETARVFKEEYFARVPKGWQDRLPVNYASAALKVALYFIQHMEPDWQMHVTKIIARTEEVLSRGYEEIQ